MSFCFGFKEESKTKAVGGKQHQFFVGAFVPLFVLLGGSGFQSDSGAFSELGGMPSAAVSEVAEAPMEVSSISVEAVEDPALIRCRWQADRQLLANIGKSATDEGTIDCSVYEKTASSGTTGKREIREKVIALAEAEYPIVAMAESISRYDDPIAGLIVGIAKKESNWGKRTPKLRGEECFNYWGYRGPGSRGMTEDGYGCFEKPSDAVETIGNRLVELSELRSTTEPANMVVWKCGSSCASHSPESVRKWISDVDIYYRQFATK